MPISWRQATEGNAMIFKREDFTVELLEEAFPLFHKHYREISAFQDIELKPDYDRYFKLDEMDMLRFFSARNDSNKLIGYGVYFVQHNMHYKDSKQAVQDILYIDPLERGFGTEFIAWCDEMLRAEKVQVVYHHVKKAHNFGKLLEKLGYNMVEYIFAKRLDKEGQ